MFIKFDFERSVVTASSRFFIMEREIDGLLNKLTDLERSVGGNSSEKAKKTISSGDAFIGLKNSMAERLHNVKHVGIVVCDESRVNERVIRYFKSCTRIVNQRRIGIRKT